MTLTDRWLCLLYHTEEREHWEDEVIANKWHSWLLKPETSDFTGEQCMSISSVQFSRSVVSDSLWPCWLQHARLPCPSPTPRACSNSCPSNWWCHPTVILCRPLLFMPSIFADIRVFSNGSVLHIRWSKCWSFSNWKNELLNGIKCLLYNLPACDLSSL